MRKREHYKTVKELYETEAGLTYLLDVFGDELAKREGYKEVYGIDAVHFYIVHKFKWLPSVVKSMNSEDLRFILSEEMSGWVAPQEAL